MIGDDYASRIEGQDELGIAQKRITALEAALAERDARIAALEQARDESRARTQELEAIAREAAIGRL